MRLWVKGLQMRLWDWKQNTELRRHVAFSLHAAEPIHPPLIDRDRGGDRDALDRQARVGVFGIGSGLACYLFLEDVAIIEAELAQTLLPQPKEHCQRKSSVGIAVDTEVRQVQAGQRSTSGQYPANSH